MITDAVLSAHKLRFTFVSMTVILTRVFILVKKKHTSKTVYFFHMELSFTLLLLPLILCENSFKCCADCKRPRSCTLVQCVLASQ